MTREIEIVSSSDGTRRVVFYWRDSGTFGFREEYRTNQPVEDTWAIGRHPDLKCASLEMAKQEAAVHLEWFANLRAKDDLRG